MTSDANGVKLVGKRGVTSLAPQSFLIDTASSGDNTIVAAIAGRKIRVMNMIVKVGGTVSLRWKSGSNSKSGAMSFTDTQGYAMAHDDGVLLTNTGEALVLNLSGAVQVSGHGMYREEDS